MPKITIGADPEMFLRESIGNKAPVSCHGLIPGDKKNPYPVTGGAIQVDGMAAEININPSATRVEFMANIKTVMDGLVEHLPPVFEIAHGVPFMEFDAQYLGMQPLESLELGCDPDYNAYTGEANPRPDGMQMFRTAAGHIHIGWGASVKKPYADKEHFKLCCEMAKQMDYYVGIYSLIWDPDNRRRSMYGAAGAFRAKPYGMEYRTPSTAWLANEELQAWVFDASMKAATDFFNGDRLADVFGEEARTIIDTNDTEWFKRIDFETGLNVPFQQAA